jgi:Tol biopolymer transport system component
LLAYATHGGNEADRLWTVSVKGQPFTVAASERVSDPVWSPDGSRIAFVGSTMDGRAWYVVEARGGGQRSEIDKLTYLNWRGTSQD